MKQCPAEPAGVASQRHAGLNAAHAAAIELGQALLKGGCELAETPGDGHQRVAMLGKSGARDRAALADAGLFVAGGREPGGGIEVLR